MATIQNDNANKNALDSLNNSFDAELHKNKKYKWYSPRIGNLVIPQVYDDSLSYYEAINKLQMLIHAEIARAITAENLLGANLDKEIQRAKQAESDLNDALKAEIARAKAEEKRLDNKIDAETDRAKAAEKTITDNLNKEIKRAKDAEEALTNALNSEIDRAKAAEKKNADAIAAETTRAANAENALGDRITAETTARQNADKALDDKITKEISDRQGADSALDNKITAEADARKAADTTINQNIMNVQNSVNTLSGKAVTDVAMTEENGTYTLTQEKNGVKSNIGTIDVGANNPVVEVKDSVVENSEKGYDFHTIGETTNDGTENTVGQFYLAQKQITSRTLNDNIVSVKYIDQDGKESEENILTNNQLGYDATYATSRADIAKIFGSTITIPKANFLDYDVYSPYVSQEQTWTFPALKKGSIIKIELSFPLPGSFYSRVWFEIEMKFKKMPIMQINCTPNNGRYVLLCVYYDDLANEQSFTKLSNADFENNFQLIGHGSGWYSAITPITSISITTMLSA